MTPKMTDETRKRIRSGEFWNDDPVRLMAVIEALEDKIRTVAEVTTDPVARQQLQSILAKL